MGPEVMNLGCHLAVISCDFLQPHSMGAGKNSRNIGSWDDFKVEDRKAGEQEVEGIRKRMIEEMSHHL